MAQSFDLHSTRACRTDFPEEASGSRPLRGVPFRRQRAFNLQPLRREPLRDADNQQNFESAKNCVVETCAASLC
jgi:hypothetical protein